MTSRPRSEVSTFSIHASKSSPWLSKSMHSRLPETAPAITQMPSCRLANHASTSICVGSRPVQVFQLPMEGCFFALAAGRQLRPAFR